MIDEIMLETEEHMEKAISGLKVAFGGVRTGSANPMLLDRIKVEYYGTMTPINQMAAIKVPDPHLLTIEPWDKSTLKAIERAINDSDLGLNPSNDGMIIRLPIPMLTEERRREFVKQCKDYAEHARVGIRKARQDANARIDKAKKASEISEDDAARAKEKVQKLTDKNIATVDELFKKKESDLMTV